MKIKVCGMCDPRNIAAVAALKPDFMGFIFYKKSPRYVGALSPETVKGIPSSIKKVGVFVNEDMGMIEQTVAEYGLDFVQLHGDESVEFCRALKGKCGIIKATSIVRASLYEDVVDYLLFDTPTPHYGGSGERFDWSELNNYKGGTPFFLSGGIGVEQGSEVRALDVFAVDVNSRFETQPGMKNIELLKKFINNESNK